MKHTFVRLEVSGPRALFTDPASGSHPTSYPWAPPSALQGMAASIRLFHAVEFRPVELRVCRNIRLGMYAFNYNGPLRDAKKVREGNGQQIFANTLLDVCYQITYELIARPEGGRSVAESHAIAQEVANTRWARILTEGAFRRPVCLGHREFRANYVGPWREENTPIQQYEVHPNFMLSLWDSAWAGQLAPKFGESQMQNGVVRFQ